MARLNSPEELQAFRKAILSKRDPDNPCISICAGAGCVASGADEVIAAFKSEIETQGLQADVDTKGTGCPGFCERGPVVVIYPAEICYLQVKPDDVPEIIEKTITENPDAGGFLFDGFPRTLPQAEAMRDAGVDVEAVDLAARIVEGLRAAVLVAVRRIAVSDREVQHAVGTEVDGDGIHHQGFGGDRDDEGDDDQAGSGDQHAGR